MKINNQLFELGLRGQKDYTRFIILARSRTGSNFLRGLLNTHPQIVVLGELFQNDRQIGWAYPGYTQSTRMLALFRKRPVEFLGQKVFRNFSFQTKAVGFKIFYYHAQSNDWKSVWEYLRQQQDLRVIHIKRKNLLKTHLSKKKAELTDVWVNTIEKTQNKTPVSITLDYKECVEAFEQTRAWENEYNAFFSKHQIFDVFYEDLARNYDEIMYKVQGFLNVDLYSVNPQTRKQAKRSLSETIENYTELKKRFKGTEWEVFFED